MNSETKIFLWLAGFIGLFMAGKKGYEIMTDFKRVLNAPENAKYKAAIIVAEKEYGIPEGMLARLIYQESHFRADIISGKIKSGAGAVGIAQIVPRWHPSVNPLDPIASIYYAAKYLHSLYQMFDSWEFALQAYNWGPGNLKKFISGSIKTMPVETSNYSREILADINGPVYA